MFKKPILLLTVLFITSCSAVFQKKTDTINSTSNDLVEADVILTSDTITQNKKWGSQRIENIKNIFLTDHSIFPGQINFVPSIPMVNFLNIKLNTSKRVISTAAIGISGGFEYYYKKNRYLYLYGSANMSFMTLLVPLPSYESDYERLYAYTIGLTNNFNFNRFTLGYGLQFTKYGWLLHEYNENSESTIYSEYFYEEKEKVNAVGLQIDANYRLLKELYIGLSYRPTFYNVSSPSKFLYQDMISINVAWKFKVRKGKSN
jgi:hypothetical protein